MERRRKIDRRIDWRYEKEYEYWKEMGYLPSEEMPEEVPEEEWRLFFEYAGKFDLARDMFLEYLKDMYTFHKNRNLDTTALDAQVEEMLYRFMDGLRKAGYYPTRDIIYEFNMLLNRLRKLYEIF